MSDVEMGEVREGGGGQETWPQGQNEQPPQGGEFAGSLKKMDQLVRQAAIYATGERKQALLELGSHWSDLRDDILLTLAQGVHDAATSAPTLPSSVPSISSTVPTNRTWASLLREDNPQVKPVPRRLEREVFVARRAIGSEAVTAITPAEAKEKVNNAAGLWGKGEVEAVRVLPSGAFDRVLRDRLVHEMRRRRVPRSIYGWVDSFMSDRRTTLAFDDQESEAFNLPGGIPQGSPLSPILFLFYNAELLERCERRDLRVSAVGFADDVNLIAYGDSTEDNCQALQEVHGECMEWARRYGARFAPEKYELMHFTRRQCFNLEAPVQIEGRVINPGAAMRILGVWLDPRLRWKGHLDALAGKLKTQVRALTCLSTSTWGLPLVQARMVYNMVIRAAISHGALAWHQPRSRTGASTLGGLAGKIAPKQNECLRVVTGAYRATPVTTLEAEAGIEPIDLYLSARVAKAAAGLQQTGMAEKIENACQAVRRGLRRREQNRRVLYGQVIHSKPIPSDWVEDWASNAEQRVRDEWYRRWQRRKTPWGELHSRPPDRRNLKLYRGLTKARCSILLQVRSGKTGLAGFLHRRKVPGFTSPDCACGNGVETPKHILVHCPRFAGSRSQLLRGGRLDTGALLGCPEGAAQLSGWWLRQSILQQFRLARELELELA